MRLFIILFSLIFGFSVFSFSHEISVTDIAGRKVSTPENVTKTAAIGPGALRMIIYAGAQDTLVGREQIETELSDMLSPYNHALGKDFKNLPVISKGGPNSMPDLGKISELSPDVVFAADFPADTLDYFQKKLNIPVVGISYGWHGHTDIEKVKTSLRLIGYITHTQDKTQKILNKMAMMRKDLLERTEGAEPVSVYAGGIAFMGEKCFDKTKYSHPTFDMLRLNNIADSQNPEYGKSTHVQMSREEMLDQQPDYIFIDIASLENLKKNYNGMSDFFMSLNAVKNHNVYTLMTYNWYNTNIEHVFLNAYFAGKKIYPEKFADVDIFTTADSIYNTFLNIDPYVEIMEKTEAFRRVLFDKNGFKVE